MKTQLTTVEQKFPTHRIYFTRLTDSPSRFDRVIPFGSVLEYACGDLEKDYRICPETGRVLTSKYSTAALQYVPVRWTGREGTVCICDVKLAA
jgi:hypothetical protein